MNSLLVIRLGDRSPRRSLDRGWVEADEESLPGQRFRGGAVAEGDAGHADGQATRRLQGLVVQFENRPLSAPFDALLDEDAEPSYRNVLLLSWIRMRTLLGFALISECPEAIA
jgi:hypothetical protein